MRRPWIATAFLAFMASATIAADVGDGVPSRPEPLGPRIETVLKRVTPSVVRLSYGEGRRPSHATGTVISRDGLVVTCEHMSPKASDIVEAFLADGRRCRAKVLAKLAGDGDRPRDLALVQLAEEGPWPAVEVGTAADLTARDPLLAMGLGGTGLYGRGRLVDAPCQVRLGHRLMNLREPPDVIPTLIRGAPGDSGGPLFDLGGRLVGTLSSDGGTGAHTLYMSADLLRREWRSLAGDRPPPPTPAEKRPAALSPAEETAAAVRAIRDAVIEVRSDDQWAGAGVLVKWRQARGHIRAPGFLIER
jgi:S1-C subfamily serine protease